MKILSSKDEIDNYINLKLVDFFRRDSLIPFLGAGFTRGAKTPSANVPNGRECMELMKELIISENSEFGEISNEQRFDQVSNFFYSIVPKSRIADFINKYFVRVILDAVKTNFIKLPWPYIYTLNIDDAIENVNHYKIVLPNKQVARHFLTPQMVFKLHGDAYDETTYIQDKEGIIFSREQYLKSLVSNQSLLNVFLEDYAKYNIIFIGCSLDDEIDLEHLLANDNINNPVNSDKIFITTEKPSPLRKIKLERFRINTCLVIEDYNSFYNTLIKKLGEIEIDNTEPFKEFQVNQYIINEDLDYNKKAICGEFELEIKNKSVKIPDLFIDRSQLVETVNKVKTEDILFIIGRRVSGKTYFLHSIARSIKNRSVYIFPSNITLDTDFINKLKTLRDSLIIFDTDTISSYDVEDIYHQISEFTALEINFIFCINSSDRLMLSIPYTRVIDKDIVELKYQFSESESHQINKKLSKYGLINFPPKVNVLNNIVHYKEIYSNLQNEIFAFNEQLHGKILKAAILSAVFDKVYSNVYRALDIDHDNLKYLTEISKGAIELEYELLSIETSQHSNFKTITNSKAFLFACLGKFIQRRENLDVAVQSIVAIVKVLQPQEIFKNIYGTIIAFDTLNEIFYKESIGGSIRLIYRIYESLQSLLNLSTHYWMQRAKSIYYMERKNIGELFKAIEYAKKPYYDSKPLSRLNMNASFQIANIYIRIANIQKFHDLDIVQNAAKWTYLILQENYQMGDKVVDAFINEAKRKKSMNEFYQFASYILRNRSKIEREHATAIISKVFGFQ